MMGTQKAVEGGWEGVGSWNSQTSLGSGPQSTSALSSSSIMILAAPNFVPSGSLV